MASRIASAARQARFCSTGPVSAPRQSSDRVPLGDAHGHLVAELEAREDGLDPVVAVRLAREHAQPEVDLRLRDHARGARAHAPPVVLGALQVAEVEPELRRSSRCR